MYISIEWHLTETRAGEKDFQMFLPMWQLELKPEFRDLISHNAQFDKFMQVQLLKVLQGELSQHSVYTMWPSHTLWIYMQTENRRMLSKKSHLR